MTEAARPNIVVERARAFAYRQGVSLDRAVVPLILVADRAKEWGTELVIATFDVAADH